MSNGGSARKILGRGGANARQRSLQCGSRQVQETDEASAGGGAPAKAAKRGGTKRITVDLPRDEHKFLRDYAYDNDADGMRVMRALLLELAEDPGLSERVARRLPEVGR